MLFRGPHESADVGAVGSRSHSEHSADNDETCSTSGRSYTSAESSTAQSFELRMAQLDSRGPLASGPKLLSPGYQLFATGSGAYADDGTGEQGDDAPHSLSLVSGPGSGNRSYAGSGTRANDYPDEDERDADYLTALLSDIERHAARLDTQFHRYPSSEKVKQQIAAHAAAAAAAAATATEGQGKKTSPLANAKSGAASGAEGGKAAGDTASTGGSAHSTGTKLFLGGLRYEVIQSGRHTVSWIFQTACGVYINPSSILIHRKTKNGRSNVAPTGCASVFVADDKDVAALLEMNQRIYCAEEGVYVSPSPEVMKELIASKDIVDVTGGRVRGPTHPVVIERAYSVSHHHGHHGAGSGGSAGAGGSAAAASGTNNTSSGGGGAAAAGGNAGAGAGRGHGGNATANATNAGGGGGGANAGAGGGRHGRSPSVISADSNLSNQRMGGMPPPYSGSASSQYAASGMSSMSAGCQPPSYTPSSVSSSSLGVPMMAVSPNGFQPAPMMMSGASTPSLPQTLDDGRGSNNGGPLKLDPQRVTFHAYLRSASHTPEAPPAARRADGAHVVLFLAALPSDSTEDYVSWLFSLMSITLPAAQIHIIGGSSTDPSADCCATVSVSEGDVSIALNYHHRVLCTSRGAWIGHSAHDIAALRASDASLRDAAVLHVDRRMSAQSGRGSNGGGDLAGPGPMVGAGGGMPTAYPYGFPMAGGPAGGPNPSLPPPPASYPPVFAPMAMAGGMAPGQPGMMAMAAPWGFAAPGPHLPMSGEGGGAAVGGGYPHLPPPPGGMMGPGGAGAIPLPSMMSVAGGYAMPPPPPPFAYTQSVTIGDRTYQLPTGGTGAAGAVPYMPAVGDGAAPPKAGSAAATAGRGKGGESGDATGSPREGS